MDGAAVRAVVTACVQASLSSVAAERDAASGVLRAWAARPDALAVAECILRDPSAPMAAGFHALRVARDALAAAPHDAQYEAWKRFMSVHLVAMPRALYAQCALVCASLFKLTWAAERSVALALACLQTHPAVVEAIVCEMDCTRCKALGVTLETHMRCHREFQTAAWAPLLAHVVALPVSPASGRVLLALLEFCVWPDVSPLVKPPSRLVVPTAEPLVSVVQLLPSMPETSTALQCLVRLASCPALPPAALMGAAARLLSPARDPLQLAHVLRKCVQRGCAVAGLDALLSAALSAAAAMDADTLVDTAEEVFRVAAAAPAAAVDAAALFVTFSSLVARHHPTLPLRCAVDTRVADALLGMGDWLRVRCPHAALETVARMLAAARGSQSAMAGACAVALAALVVAPRADAERRSIPTAFAQVPASVTLVVQLVHAVLGLASSTPVATAHAAELHAAYLLFLLHVVPVYLNASDASPFDAHFGRGLPASQLVSQFILPYLATVLRHPHAPGVLRAVAAGPVTGAAAVRDARWASLTQLATVVAAEAASPPALLLDSVVCAAAHFKTAAERAAQLRALVGSLVRQRVSILAVARALLRAAPPGAADAVRALFVDLLSVPGLDAAATLKCWIAFCHAAELDSELWARLAAQLRLHAASQSARVAKALAAACMAATAPSLRADVLQLGWSFAAHWAAGATGAAPPAPLVRLVARMATFSCDALWSAPDAQRASVVQLLCAALASVDLRSVVCATMVRLTRHRHPPDPQWARPLVLEVLRRVASQDGWTSTQLLDAADALSAGAFASMVDECVALALPGSPRHPGGYTKHEAASMLAHLRCTLLRQ